MTKIPNLQTSLNVVIILCQLANVVLFCIRFYISSYFMS